MEEQKLPLHAFHLSQRARMVPFAGYEMPIQYPAGTLQEHLHTRAAAGLFDVSHMGQITLRPRSGNILDAARALESLVPADIVSLSPGRQRYALFTNESGGIRDDLMVANLGEYLLLVVNAACKAADEAHLREHLSGLCDITSLSDRALLALQGPKACAALAELAPAVAGMRFMDVGVHTIAGASCFVTRSGYTGEDGFEISVPIEKVELLAEQLVSNPQVELIGLGARDSLRLEAGLCLYGNDIDSGTTPVEAALEWAMQRSRRKGGARAGGFPGSEVILAQLEHGTGRRRVGLQSALRPVRAGALLFTDEKSDTPIGQVTSGGFGPSVGGPVAMGYVPSSAASIGTQLYAQVRNERSIITVAALPFAPHNYQR
jgi:glycine cleavage system T protein (aminomethyltransferase)